MRQHKNHFLRYLATATMLAITMPVYAASFNFGFGLGQGKIDVDKDNFNDGSLGSSTTTDPDTTVWGAYGEVKFNRFARLEFGILDGSMASMEGFSNGSGSYWGGGPVSADYGLGAIKVGGVGVIPFGANDKFKLLGKIGLANWFSLVSLSDNYYEDDELDTGISPYLGVGAELDLTDIISLRLQYETFNASADSDYFADGYDFTYQGTTIGMLFRF